jgi:PBP1b-binding outer membrane lipoprotein LpoB
MLTKKSKLAILSLALLTAMVITSCNNESEKKEEPVTDSTKTEMPAATDTTKPAADTMKVDTASTRPIKNPS